MYDKPKVTIDLAEYNELTKAKKERDEDDYNMMKSITTELLSHIARKDPSQFQNIVYGIKQQTGFSVSLTTIGHKSELLIYKDK